VKHLRPYFKTLCEDHRLEIIGLLIEREHCVCELIDKLNLSQATVSYHVKKLSDAGLIQCRQLGKSTYCSLDKQGFESYHTMLHERLFKPVAKAEPGKSFMVSKN